MENRRFVTHTLFFLIIVSLFFTRFVFAYSPDTTHRGLARDTVRLFNHHNQNKITDAERSSMEKGSVDEDVHERPLNHFYDPVYNRGIIGGVTSKRWAQETPLQSGLSEQGAVISAVTPYFGSRSDYSWERAIYEYVHGDRERAFETLGHIIHLIQDASVPDHTRNDAHPPLFHFGSPYEEWTNQFDVSNIFVSGDLIADEVPVPILGNLGAYFDSIATYSNSNFFSKDTISNEVYSVPNLSRVVVKQDPVTRETFAYFTNSGGTDRILYKIETEKVDGEFRVLDVVITDKNNQILSGYWNLLSREAVLHGAGVLNLFFEEVERERESLALLKKNENTINKVLASVTDPFKKIFSKLLPSGESSENQESNNGEGSSEQSSQGGTTQKEEQKLTTQQVSPESADFQASTPEPTKPTKPTGPTLQELQAQLNQASALVAFIEAFFAEQDAEREAECIKNSIRGPWDKVGWIGDKPGCDDPTPRIQKMFWLPIQGVGGSGIITVDAPVGPPPGVPPGQEF
ncbi:MAG: hypothetical protein JKX80_01665 [Candidatus Pacebacteria bacterium]|nr:hypothetical protein [Candidatus Paceibacterota bacterium]